MTKGHDALEAVARLKCDEAIEAIRQLPVFSWSDYIGYMLHGLDDPVYPDKTDVFLRTVVRDVQEWLAVRTR